MKRRWAFGDCWFGCERTDLPVLWLGPLQWDGHHAPVYSCADCLDRLQRQADDYFFQRRSDVA